MDDVHTDDNKMDIEKRFEPLNVLLCSQLINTYNTTILDKMDLHIQEALKEEAALFCATTNKQKERTMLKELINRHYNTELRSKRQHLLPAYIGGPFSLTCHLNKDYQKLILVFFKVMSNKDTFSSYNN